MEGSRGTARTAKFLGSYLHQIDGKGRVSLPAPYRREATDQGFVLMAAHSASLSLYPEAAWVEVQERLQDLQRHQPESRMWVLKMMATAVEVSPDSQGRILVPARLQEWAQLTGEVLLVGAIDKVELWNPDTFHAAVAEEAGQFDRFAAQIFR
jgi:MraZ protein